MVRQVTESEKVDKTLPRACFTVEPPYTGGEHDPMKRRGRLVIMVRGHSGLRGIAEIPTMTLGTCAGLNHVLLGASKAQMVAMYSGAICGWSDPRAFASFWENLPEDEWPKVAKQLEK